VLHALAAKGDQRAARMAAAVWEFRDRYAKGKKALRDGRLKDATRALGRALELDRLLGSGYRSTLERQVAAALVRQGEQAFDADRLEVAFKAVQKARMVHPRHEGAGELLERLLQKGRELTIEAVAVRDQIPPKARRLLKTVRRITPPDSAVHRRAAELLGKLED